MSPSAPLLGGRLISATIACRSEQLSRRPALEGNSAGGAGAPLPLLVAPPPPPVTRRGLLLLLLLRLLLFECARLSGLSRRSPLGPGINTQFAQRVSQDEGGALKRSGA